ncbi:MAG: NAD(P)H-dependent oxidoreductase [Marmoricola sp.]
MNILMLVGSLRAGSWTATLADSLVDLLPLGTHASVFGELADVPHYSEDLDTEHPPAAARALREAVAAADVLVVATPEYNGSLPGVLKNAIDWTSRPRGSAALAGKRVAVISVSPSPRGAQWAREDAEKVLRVAGAVPLATSVGVASVHSVVTDGKISDPDLLRALSDLVTDLLAADPAAA